MKVRKIKDLRKTNKGNRHPRTDTQKLPLIRRLLLDNPAKKPINRMRQSTRMIGNQRWKLRKNQNNQTATIPLTCVNKGEN